MCFYLESSNDKIKMAKEPIVCYKMGTPKGSRRFYPAFRTEFKYIKNRRTNLIIIQERWDVVDEGYHSYKREEYAKQNLFSNNQIKKFVIPEGAYYYENHECYVSSSIVYLGSETWWTRLLKKIKISK